MSVVIVVSNFNPLILKERGRRGGQERKKERKEDGDGELTSDASKTLQQKNSDSGHTQSFVGKTRKNPLVLDVDIGFKRPGRRGSRLTYCAAVNP